MSNQWRRASQYSRTGKYGTTDTTIYYHTLPISGGNGTLAVIGCHIEYYAVTTNKQASIASAGLDVGVSFFDDAPKTFIYLASSI